MIRCADYRPAYTFCSVPNFLFSSFLVLVVLFFSFLSCLSNPLSFALFLSLFLTFLSCFGVPVPCVPGVPASSRTFDFIFTLLPVCIRMLPVCCSYVLVCDSYVTRMYSYVTRLLLVCTRMWLLCYPYVLVCYSYIVVCYLCVPVWCFSHDPTRDPRHLATLLQFQWSEEIF